MPIEMLIAWSDQVAGRAMALMLEREPGAMGIRCEVSELADAAVAAGALQPRVLLLEMKEPWKQTLKLLALISAASPMTRSLLAYDSCTREQMVEAIRHGACGCVLKNIAVPVLAKSVQTLYEGGTWYGREALLEALQAQLCATVALPEPVIEDGRLTRREEEILRLIGQGLTNKEIGRLLDISDQTVKTHLHRVYAKLHQSGRYKAFLAQPIGRQTPGLGPA